MKWAAKITSKEVDGLDFLAGFVVGFLFVFIWDALIERQRG